MQNLKQLKLILKNDITCFGNIHVFSIPSNYTQAEFFRLLNKHGDTPYNANLKEFHRMSPTMNLALRHDVNCLPELEAFYHQCADEGKIIQFNYDESAEPEENGICVKCGFLF